MATDADPSTGSPTRRRPCSTRTGWAPRRCPSRTLYPHQWNWDSAFIAMGRSWVRRAAGAAGAAVAVPGPVVGRARAAHRVQPVGGGGGVLPGAGVLAVVAAVGGGAAGRGDLGHHPAAAPCRGPRSRCTGTRATSTRRSRSCAGSTRASSPSTTTSRAAGGPADARCRCSCTRGSRASTTRRPGTATSRSMVIPEGAIPPYVRHDLDHANPADRPTNAAYDQFVFLAARYRDSGYDDDQLLDQVPFLVAGTAVQRDPPVVHPRAGGDRRDRRAGSGAPPRVRATDPRRDAVRTCGTRRRTGSGRSTWSATSGASRTRSSRSRRCWTRTCRRPSWTRSWPTSARRASTRTGRTATWRRRSTSRPRASTSGATGAGPSGSTPTGCCGWASASTARTPRPTQILRSSLRLVDRGGFHEYFDPFGGAAFGTDGFGWTAALTLDVIERHRGAEHARLLDWLEEP